VADALAMGLITRQMESNALIDEATKLAQQLAEGPTRAFGECKRLLAVGFDQDLAMHLGDEGATITRLSATPYAIEGIEAFIDKRAPRFD
jgi:2-(1,2-epoxy-1,2-dihydrophenyl)acetyl-CoA isomerase